MDDDSRLLQQFIATRDGDSFEQLVHHHIDLVYAAARRQMHDAHAAEDVTQAVFIVLSRKADRLIASGRPNVMLSGWLYQVVRLASVRALRDQARRRRKDEAAAKAVLESQAARPESQSQLDEMLPHVDEALARLRPHDREAVLMRFYRRQSFAEVAGALGISEEAARKRVERALDRMRSILRRRPMPLPARRQARNATHSAGFS